MQNTIRSICFSDAHTDIVNVCSILSRCPQVVFTHLFNSTPTPQTNPYMHTHTKKCGVTMNMRATGSYQCFHLGSSLLFLSSSFWLSSPSLHHQVWNMKSAFSNVVDFTLFSAASYVSLKRDIIMALKNPVFVWHLERRTEQAIFFFFHSFFPYHMSFALSLSHRDPALGSSAWCRICSDYH